MITALIILGLLGLIIGSFINALVWRLHEQAKPLNDKQTKNRVDLSITRGRSVCPNCHHQLAAIDLVPIYSWLSLGGKCRYCHKNISSQYPIVEISTAILFVLSYKFWPHTVSGIEAFKFIIWLALLTGLIALFIYDLKWRILPTRLIYPLFVVAVLLALLNIFNSTQPFVTFLSIVLSAIVGGGIFFLIYQVSNGKWIGGGDVRLGWLLGLIAGTPAKSGLFIFLAAILGSLLAVPLLLTKKLKRTSTLPFGPFLITGIVLVEFFGSKILNWYFNLVIRY